MSRPSIAPGLVADITAAIPARIVKKLDEAPRQAEAWTWATEGDAVRVTTPNGDNVRLHCPDNVVRNRESIICTCLLKGRCLHVLAVVTLLEPENAAEEEPPAAPEPVRETVMLDPAQVRAAAVAFGVGADILGMGAATAGALVQAELLRCIHEAQSQGLYRLAAAGLRLLRDTRSLRASEPDFRLADLHDDLSEWLLTARQLSNPSDPSWLGTARRTYEEAGTIRLHGLFVEPVIARSGHTGVSLTVTDGRDRFFTLSDVRPGEADRVGQVYGLPPGYGGLATSFRCLCREGFFVSGATSSADGRLGGGSGARAVSAGPSPWEGFFQKATPIKEALSRFHDGLKVTPEQRPAGWDLLFAEAVVLGASGDALVLALAPRPGDSPSLPVLGLAPSIHPTLKYRDNLRILARAPGLPLRIVARLVQGRSRSLQLLAVGSTDASEGPSRLVLPEDWGGRVNLGLEALQGGHVQGATSLHPIAVDPSQVFPLMAPDPLVALRRRLQRLALGGRATLPAVALAEVEREQALLRRRLMPRGAELLGTLAALAQRGGRRVDGRLEATDPQVLARAWSEAAVYEAAARGVLERGAWEG